MRAEPHIRWARLVFFAVALSLPVPGLAVTDGYTLQRAIVAQPSVRIRVAEEGMVKVTYEDLLALGWTGLNAALSSYQLYHQGTALPLLAVESGSSDNKLQAGEYLIFYAAPTLDRYRQTDAYWLTAAASGSRIASRDAAPSGSDLSYHMATVKFEQNTASLYVPSFTVLPGEIDDRFFWNYALDYTIYGLGNIPFSTSFDLPGYLVSGQDPEASIDIVARGGVESDTLSPDHRLDVTLNSRALGYLTSEDKREMRGTLAVAAGTLAASGNSLNLAVNLSPGLTYDILYINRFYVTYPRSFAAVSGRLDFTSPADGPVTVNGVDGASALVLEVTAGVPTLLTNLTRDSTSVRFQTVSGRKYFVGNGAAPNAVALPSALPPLLTEARSVNVPYLILHPAGWDGELAGLISLYRADGMTAVLVPVEPIYDVYGYGNANAQAIQSFLAEMVERSPGLAYLLLVGDATYDPFNLTGRGEKDWLPTRFVDTDYFETASDTAYADVSGVGQPAFHVGRIAAKTPTEVAAWVSKRLQYETMLHAGTGLSDLLFVSDDPDTAGAANPYSAFNEKMLAYLPARFSPEHFIVPEGVLSGSDEITALRQQLIGSWLRPNLLVSYAGHGAASFWAGEQVLRNNDIPSLLAPAGWPTVLAWNCLNGYFINPYEPSMAEKMLLTPDAGAVAMLATSGLSSLGAQQKVAEEFFRLLFQSEVTTLGELFDRARAKVAGSSSEEVVARIAILFGDPAMKLAPVGEIAPTPTPTPTPTPAPAGDSGGCGYIPGSSGVIWLGLWLVLIGRRRLFSR